MADTKPKPEDVKPEAKAVPKAEAKAADLKPAGESTNPEVHTLLAELESYRLNGNEDAADEVLDRLAKLGYSAS